MPSKTGKDSYPDCACITFVCVKTEFYLFFLLCRKLGGVDFFNGVMNLRRQIIVVDLVGVGAIILRRLILCSLSLNVHVELGLA